LTYVNEANHCGSTIDYFLTSAPSEVIAFNIIDLDINLSDHRPVMAIVTQGWTVNATNSRPPDDVTYLRWDHSPLNQYNEYTRMKLQPVLADMDLLVKNIDTMSTDCVKEAIDCVYASVVDTLLFGSEWFIMKVKKDFLKFWWCQELDDLKEKAILSCRLWKDAGKPRNGQIHGKYIRDKLSYKKRIREERSREANCFSNDLHDALLHKSGKDFWKSWNSKFKSKNVYLK
jgi:hypothetical protein